MLSKVRALPEELGEAETLLADTGYFSARNVEACEKAGIEPLIAMGPQPHHPPLEERFEPTPVEGMAHRLKTPEGRDLQRDNYDGRTGHPSCRRARDLYALRKQTPEPVFGIIKSVLGFRQFSMRGLEKVRGEWSLVTMAWNMKQMSVLNPACRRHAQLGAVQDAHTQGRQGAVTTRSGPDLAANERSRWQNRPGDQAVNVSPTGC
jgi:hypothetical protein